MTSLTAARAPNRDRRYARCKLGTRFVAQSHHLQCVALEPFGIPSVITGGCQDGVRELQSGLLDLRGVLGFTPCSGAWPVALPRGRARHTALTSRRHRLFEMKKLRKRAKAAGVEIRKVSGKFRLWNVRTGSHLDLKKKRRVKQLLRRIQGRNC
jgi:hypothetical protein